MNTVLHYVQIVSAIVLVALVLIQRTQGDMGASGTDNATFAHTRRGAEKFIFFSTIVVAILFVAASILIVVK